MFTFIMTIKAFVVRILRALLSVIKSLFNILCCRRKKADTTSLLPVTVRDVVIEVKEDIDNEAWVPWTLDDKKDELSKKERSDHVPEQNMDNNDELEDYFKDMVPQIRKPKKLYVIDSQNDNINKSHSSRLSMDPSAVIPGPELGIIDDNPSNWETSENMEELSPWEFAHIKENRLAEREKRIAEHQRRKQEKENKRASKQDKTKLSLVDSKDKAKCS